jgi:hypothetical protein
MGDNNMTYLRDTEWKWDGRESGKIPTAEFCEYCGARRWLSTGL